MAGYTDIVKIKNRMCKTIKKCQACPLWTVTDGVVSNCKDKELDNPEEIERICFGWAIEHPEITNADKFFEIFGFNPINQCCVKASDCPMCKPGGPNKCDGCKYEKFWQKPYSESKEKQNV